MNNFDRMWRLAYVAGSNLQAVASTQCAAGLARQMSVDEDIQRALTACHEAAEAARQLINARIKALSAQMQMDALADAMAMAPAQGEA